MVDVQRLEQIAQQLVARVRDDAPETNGRWLLAETTEQDRWALLFILASAVPDTERWRDLTAWCSDRSRADTPLRQAMRRQALTNAMAPRRRRAA